MAETGPGVDLAVGTDAAVFGDGGCRDREVWADSRDQLCNLANWLGWAVGSIDRLYRGGFAATQATTAAPPGTSACGPPTTACRSTGWIRWRRRR